MDSIFVVILMPRGGPTKHENHPHLNPLPSRERISFSPPGGRDEREGVFF